MKTVIKLFYFLCLIFCVYHNAISKALYPNIGNGCTGKRKSTEMPDKHLADETECEICKLNDN